MHPGSKEFRRAEREAQARYEVPLDKAGRDYIARPMNTKAYRDNFDLAFGRVPDNTCPKCGESDAMEYDAGGVERCVMCGYFDVSTEDSDEEDPDSDPEVDDKWPCDRI